MELSLTEIVLILLAALLIYGGRLPEVARTIGRSIGDLRRGLMETRDQVTAHLDVDPPRPTLRVPAPPEAARQDASAETPGGEAREPGASPPTPGA